MITWTLSRNDDQLGSGNANTAHQAWTAALALAAQAATRTGGIDPLHITVDGQHARLYPGCDPDGHHDPTATSNIAADLLDALTDDPNGHRVPRVAGEPTATADDPARVRAGEVQRCRLPWGVCPEHGNTLCSSRGRTWRQTCGREWGYDRLTGGCPEPVTHLVTDPTGQSTPVCAGHALTAHAQLTNATITSLPAT